MPVNAKKRVTFIVFFSVVYLVLLKVVMDSEWSFAPSRRIVWKEEGETGLKEVISSDRGREGWNTKDGEEDLSHGHSSSVIEAGRDGEGTKSLGIDAVKIATRTLRQERSSRDEWERFSVTQKSIEDDSTTDDPENKRYQVIFTKDAKQEDAQDKASMRKLLMVNSNTKKLETFPEDPKTTSPSRVLRQRETLQTITGEDLRPVEPRNVASVANLSLSPASKHEELPSLNLPSLDTSSEEPTAASAAGLPPRPLKSPETGAEQSLTLDIAVRGTGVTVAVDGRQVRSIKALHDMNEICYHPS